MKKRKVVARLKRHTHKIHRPILKIVCKGIVSCIGHECECGAVKDAIMCPSKWVKEVGAKEELIKKYSRELMSFKSFVDALCKK